MFSNGNKYSSNAASVHVQNFVGLDLASIKGRKKVQFSIRTMTSQKIQAIMRDTLFPLSKFPISILALIERENPVFGIF
jgi:hypothetical protein